MLKYVDRNLSGLYMLVKLNYVGRNLNGLYIVVALKYVLYAEF